MDDHHDETGLGQSGSQQKTSPDRPGSRAEPDRAGPRAPDGRPEHPRAGHPEAEASPPVDRAAPTPPSPERMHSNPAAASPPPRGGDAPARMYDPIRPASTPSASDQAHRASRPVNAPTTAPTDVLAATSRSVFDVPLGLRILERGSHVEPVLVFPEEVPALLAAEHQGFLLVGGYPFKADAAATAYRAFCNRVRRPCVVVRRHWLEAEIRLAMQPTNEFLPPEAVGQLLVMLLAEGLRPAQVAVDPAGTVVRGVPLGKARGLARRLYHAVQACEWVEHHPYVPMPTDEEWDLIEGCDSEDQIYSAFETCKYE